MRKEISHSEKRGMGFMKRKRLFAILLAALMLLSLLPAGALAEEAAVKVSFACSPAEAAVRSEEHTSELQSR